MKKYRETIFRDKSEFLDGAIAVSGDAPIFLGGKFEDASVFVEFVEYLVDGDKFKKDEEHDIFVNENGAVANAYVFNGMNNKELAEAKTEILVEMAEKYPQYDFKIENGEFPVWSNYNELDNSTHVLYITNYKEHLKENKNKVKIK